MKDKNLFNYKNRKYDIGAYDARWGKIFVDEANTIKNIFGSSVLIEHIGSTAVPGMTGKSCIDILVIPKDLEIVRGHIPEMEQAGYLYRGAFVKDDALLFAKMEDGTLQTNVHFFPEGHPHIEEMLAVRDYLRNDAREIIEYSELKRKLSQQYPNDYNMYRKKKDEYMEKLTKRAKKWYADKF